MLNFLRHCWMGLLLIALAAALLLVSDLDRRERSAGKPPRADLPRVAVLQWTATDLLDSTVAGITEGLRQRGYEQGRTARIKYFNASGDAATANLMAREVTGGEFDLVLTASTLALQTVAAANRQRRVPHVFGGVTDPYGAGVGITGPAPDQHPPYLTGVGTFQPVEQAIGLARQMNPQLKRLGVVWNPAEDNSEACLRKARAACAAWGIALEEANAGTTAEVAEAIRSVLARRVQAVWVGGDTVAMSAINTILAAARDAGVPVFSNDPSDAARGALFGLGASYRQVGQIVGDVGGQILAGASPAAFGVSNVVPEVLTLNEPLAATLTGWAISEEHRLRARIPAPPAPPAAPVPEPGRTYRVGLLYFGPNPVFEMATAGVREGLQMAGFREGENLVIHEMQANNDLSILPQVVQQLVALRPDLLIPLSTPCLAAVLNVTRDTVIPVVFGVVSAPLEAGAGESLEKHLPHVTGAVFTAPAPEAFDWMARIFPAARSLGLPFNPAQANSEAEAKIIRALCARRGWRLVERGIHSPSEAVEMMQSLLQANPDLVFGMGDNTVVSAMEAVAQACAKANVPLVVDDNSLMGSGGLFSIGGSPHLEGRHAGRMAARVLLGEDPAAMPFEPSVETETAVDLAAAKRLGISLPVALLKEASVFHQVRSRHDRPMRIAMVNLVHAPGLERAEAGVVRGLQESGLVEGEDFTIRHYNAQGEIAQLPALLDAARNTDPDLIITITTPAMMAAVHRIRDIPVLFSVASDPVALGLFTKESVPPNLTGVHDDPPLDRLLDLAMAHDPALKAVGIVYDPAQPNAVLSAGKLRAACAQKHMTLYEATASSQSDLGPAVQYLIQRQAGALLLSADNLVNAGFPLIIKIARGAEVPVFVTDVGQMEEGATGAVGDDYASWGVQSGQLAAQVLAGVPPAALALQRTRVQTVCAPGSRTSAAGKKPHVIRIVRYNDAIFSEDSARGILDRFREAGWQEGRDFHMRILNAQGDMATLSTILSTVVQDEPDLIMPISTPALQATLRQAGSRPVVFTSVGDAVRAGAGEDETNHLPNVTGITTKSPFTGMARLIRQTMPQVTRVGTLYAPSEINSQLYRAWFEEALQAEGIRLVAVPVNASADVSEATLALLRTGIQLVCQIADNATRPGYGQIIARASAAGLPFFCFDSSGLQFGGTLALARDYYQAGREAAEVALEVLQGRRPDHIPFANTRSEVLLVNPERMKAFGLALPPEFADRAVIHHED